MIHVLEDVLKDPMGYREAALTTAFRSYEFGPIVFHGISAMPLDSMVPTLLAVTNPGLEPKLSFFRKSPDGQVEPHFIHTDVDMGEWSSILYLNPDPPEGDGTDFWMHLETGAIGSHVPHERSEQRTDPNNWFLRQHVEAKFNRMGWFPAWYFHSRAIFQNYGEGVSARLTQVTFGVGDLKGAIRGKAA